MRTPELLLYAYDQVQETLRAAVRGLTADQLGHRISPDANPIGWLAWHLLRVQDDHIADVAGSEQVWTAEGWVGRFDLPFAPSATGYGFGSDQVAASRARVRPGRRGQVEDRDREPAPAGRPSSASSADNSPAVFPTKVVVPDAA